MDTPDQKTFGCTVVAPSGRLLDCKTTSVVLPAHDGMRGILYNHMPMFCQLALGIMKVTAVTSDKYKGPSQTDVFVLIDGGFALLAANSLTIIAYDALALHDTKTERMEALMEKANRNLAAATPGPQRRHELEKIALLNKLSVLPTTSPDLLQTHGG